MTTSELATQLDSGNLNARRDAAFTLANIASNHEASIQDAIPSLFKSFGSNDKYVNIFAAHALASSGYYDDRILSVYAKCMSSLDSWERVQACCGIRKNDRLLQNSSDILHAAINDRDASVVWEAVQSIQKMQTITDSKLLAKMIGLFSNPATVSSPVLQADILKAISKAAPEQACDIISMVENVSIDPEIKSVKDETLETLKRATRNK